MNWDRVGEIRTGQRLPDEIGAAQGAFVKIDTGNAQVEVLPCGRLGMILWLSAGSRGRLGRLGLLEESTGDLELCACIAW